jgi:hypothetical protein
MGMQQTIQQKILQTYQSKTLRTITGAIWFFSNVTLPNNLKIPFVHEEITLHATHANYALLATATG